MKKLWKENVKESLRLPFLRSKNKYQQQRKRGQLSRTSESVSSSVASNLNYRVGGQQGTSAMSGGGGGPHDLTKVLLTDDYFSDANPRSMRRLMNVLYVIGRLLKAFQGLNDCCRLIQ